MNVTTSMNPISKSCESQGYFFHSRPLTSPSSLGGGQGEGIDNQMLLLTVLMDWHSIEEKQEWHTKFAKGCNIYERLGHKIDALRIVCCDVASVQSKVFRVNEDGPFQLPKRAQSLDKLPISFICEE